MDDRKLDKILKDIDPPAADDNARKVALNLAMAEFDRHQKEQAEKKQKRFQGFSFLSRLMGKSNSNPRRDPMETQKLKSKTGLRNGVALVALGAAIFSMPFLYQTTISTLDGAGSSDGIRSTALQGLEHGQGLADMSGRAPAPARLRATVQNEVTGISSAESQAFMASPSMPQAGAISRTVQGDIMIAPIDIQPNFYQEEGRDQFEDFEINPIKLVGEEPVSTFSVDVDTASYSFMRRQLNKGVLPQPDAIRVEELINYFDYDYPVPETKAEPFLPTVTVTESPWTQGRELVHIGIKGYELSGPKPKSNLVFLLDVSGSMNSPDKLPLLKNSMKMLVETLDADDTVSIVVYAGAAGVVLEPTAANKTSEIFGALDRLSAGGGTAGGAGIRLAYQLAEQNFDKEGVNRVILATDGDFNVGIHNPEELKGFVERKRETGVFLSVLGFGQGNYNDAMMQTLAQNGNGVAAYIDSLSEARKVLVEEASSTLFPIAKDVKIQVEFNPETVADYRLVGYETRALNREDFNNDKIDAGDIGAGHTVTAIYEITPVGADVRPAIDPSRYGTPEPVQVERTEMNSEFGNEYAFLKMRYKRPDEDTSNLITTPIMSDVVPLTEVNDDTQFSIAVAGFGQILKGGQHTGNLSFDNVIDLARAGKGDDEFGYRAEFINLVRLAKNARDM